eukprot:TRINITY_DN26607_c0_g1_i1.p1 TRINITY_DN26607_c0_g1~~TRINITY_DN26607_c0_g1_i1.p1  ORF type:complete len:322 (-),score=-18.70 TRINITY_DN26607_c0_g1_i1:135-1100(-)
MIKGHPAARRSNTNLFKWVLLLTALFVFLTLFVSPLIQEAIETKPSRVPAKLEDKLDFLVNEIVDLRKENKALRERVQQTELTIVRSVNQIDPWSRCLRINYRKNCDDGASLASGKVPCGATVLREMANVLTEAMEAAGITHWVSYGTLLGAARSQTILPWTGDVDIVVIREHYPVMEQKLKETGVLQKHGYIFFYDQKSPGIGRVCITEKSNLFIQFDKGDVIEKELYYNDYPYVDIYQTVENSDAAAFSVVYGPDCHWKRDFVFPLTKIMLYDREVYAPGNTSAYLHMLYGPNWRDPPTAELKRKQGAYDKACKPEWKL